MGWSSPSCLTMLSTASWLAKRPTIRRAGFPGSTRMRKKASIDAPMIVIAELASRLVTAPAAPAARFLRTAVLPARVEQVAHSVGQDRRRRDRHQEPQSGEHADPPLPGQRVLETFSDHRSPFRR